MAPIKSIGILGAGAAGYLTALCLQNEMPQLDISIIESPRIPIIGVGEASTNLLVGLLHDVLKFDIREFNRLVQPTWKMGLRFWWGQPGPEYFDYPFGALELERAFHYQKNLKYISLGSVLMDRGKSFLVPGQGSDFEYEAIPEATAYAYHLDVKRFVQYLRTKALERGIRRRIVEVEEVVLDDRDEVVHLQGTAGEILAYDLYVDCSGFRSVILGQALKTEFMSYSKSLFTNRALVGAIPNSGPIQAMSESITMKHGWRWRLQLRHESHIGYVYSSNFCSDEEAHLELKSHFPALENSKVIKFKSGRHHQFWRGNVIALGNAYGFIEPLDATGMHLTINTIQLIIAGLRQKRLNKANKRLLNERVAQQWDYIRWLISLQFKYNWKLQTPFWESCQQDIDISDHEELISIYKEHGMISLLPKDLQYLLIPPQIYKALVGNNVIDTKLLGMGVEPKAKKLELTPREAKAYREKIQRWERLADLAIPYEQALDVLDNHPESIDWNRLKFGVFESLFKDQAVVLT